jgi:thiamine-monophosphate kinase
MLAGGDDYELCFTAPPARRRAVAAAAERGGVAVARIGTITAAGRGAHPVTVIGAGGKRLDMPHGGYDHFR